MTQGRPKGSAHRLRDNVIVRPPACPNCGCSIRHLGKKYLEQEHLGCTIDGHKYTHIVWRRTRCPCGQYLTVRVFENRDRMEPASARQKTSL